MVSYILNQEKHHARLSFRDEYRQFLKNFEIEHEEPELFAAPDEAEPVLDLGEQVPSIGELGQRIVAAQLFEAIVGAQEGRFAIGERALHDADGGGRRAEDAGD